MYTNGIITPSCTHVDSTRSKIHRKGGPKSKRGCQTCKIRRVRCDETHPFCRNCTNTGRKCEGPAVAQSGYAQLTFTRPLTASPDTGLSRDEAIHLDLFRHGLVDKIFDEAGWQKLRTLILQGLHGVLAVRHAAIALGAFHRSDWGIEYSVHHYSKSISSLRQLLRAAHQEDSSTVDMSLMGSLLCLSFDVLRSSPETARIHLEHAINLINHFQEVDVVLSEAFLRLDVQASSYIGRRVPIISSKFASSPLQSFASTDSAAIELYKILCRLWSFLRSPTVEQRYLNPQHTTHNVRCLAGCLQAELENWRAMFNALSQVQRAQGLVEENMPFQDKFRKIMVLEINCLVSIIMLTGCLDPNESLYDIHEQDFSRIVVLARWAINGTAQDESKATLKNFSLGMGTIYPLYWTVEKCRFRELRKSALRLLQGMRAREGIWESAAMAAIAEKVVCVEEEGLSDSYLHHCGVPERQRVHSVDMRIDSVAGEANFSCRSLPDGPDGEWQDVTFMVKWK